MIHQGDCVTVMATMPADSVDAVCTDPPYGLGFMSKQWDTVKASHLPPSAEAQDTPLARFRTGKGPAAVAFDGRGFQAWCTEWGREALRVTKPGGYLLAFGGTRTHHRLVCGLEDAGWIIRDELDWIYACLSDDTEILTDQGWVPYNRASEATHAAAFDTDTGQLRWERIAAVHHYDHDGPMVEYGPALTTLNHRVVLSPESQVPLPRNADLHRLWGQLRDVGSVPSGAGQDVLPQVLAEAVVHASRSEAAGGSQGTLVLMRDVREADVEAGRVGQAHHRANVLLPVQRQAEDSGSPVPSGAGVERGTQGEGRRGDARSEELGLEGRRYRVQEARELLWSALRAGAGLGEADGSQGRVRDGASATDGSARGLPDDQDRGRQPREPRPDRQSPGEPEPLAGQPDPQAVRVGQGDRGDGLPPGDTPRLVDYAGVVWCITVPSGAFVARRGGVAFVTGNSGFPKGKANLKPAHEPIVLARKPGPLRPLAIDECRIGTDGGGTHCPDFPEPCSGHTNHGRYSPTVHVQSEVGGRWPSNLLLSDPELFDTANPYVVGSGAVTASGSRNGIYAGGGYRGDWPDVSADIEGDVGGYSRFFIIPKSARADREPVLRGQLERQEGGAYAGGEGLPGRTQIEGQWVQTPIEQRKARENSHPTVKPVVLMRHLVRLVTPPGGTVLDPFLGSGSTAIAAEMEGFPWIGIEQDASYVAIAEARLNGVQRGLGLDVPAPTRRDIGKQRGNKDADGNPTLAGPANLESSWFHSDPEEAA